MANKTSAKQGSSGEQERGTPRVSRKVIGKSSAPYERKAGAEGGEEKKPGSEGEQAAAADPAAKAESKAGAETATAEPAPDQGKNEPSRAARKEAAARREGKAPEPAAEAAPKPEAAPEPAPAAPKPEAAADEPAPAAAEAAPAEPPPLPAIHPAAELETLLKPKEIERWDPATPAPPPRKAPPGDSRSLRRRGEGAEEFVLIYRVGSFLIKRAGHVGVMGTWTVTEYPNIGSAAHAYAQQCSDLIHAGFRDLR